MTQATIKLQEDEKKSDVKLSPFPTVFSTRLENFLPSSLDLNLSSANSFSLEGFKIYSLGNG